jgi:MerR family transcriptional regulator/heat shock protein HspR
MENGVYIISVAARLLEVHPQTLRKYEKFGLVSPSRSVGMLRLYSEEDLIRLRIIKALVDDYGVNLSGISIIMDLVQGMQEFLLIIAKANNSNYEVIMNQIENRINILIGRVIN